MSKVNEEQNPSGPSIESPHSAPIRRLPFNDARALLYELTIANAPYSPSDCRDLADKIGARIGCAEDGVKAVLDQLETVDTVKLAAKGLTDEATAVGQARVLLDRLITEPPERLTGFDAWWERRKYYHP